MDPRTFRLEFYEDENGSQPARHWLRTELSSVEQRTVGASMYSILQQQGIGVCGSDFGKQLDGGSLSWTPCHVPSTSVDGLPRNRYTVYCGGRVTGQNVLRKIREAGCKPGQVRQRGSHVRVESDGGRCKTTVPMHRGQDLPAGTIRAIERDLEPCLGRR